MKLSIKQKLTLLGVIQIAALVMVGGIFAYSSSMNDTNRQENARVQKMKVTMEQINTGVLLVRRREKDFLLRNDVKYVEKHKKDMVTNSVMVDSLMGLAQADGVKQSIRELKIKLDAYNKSFHSMVGLKQKVGLNEKAGLLGALRNAVHEAEEDLKKTSEMQLTVSMLMMRRHEKDYLARGKAKYIDKMAKQQKKFAGLLAGSNLAGETKNKLSGDMKAYHDEFLALVDGMNAIDEEIANFRDVVHAIDPVMELLDERIVAVFDADNARQESEVQRISSIISSSIIVSGGIILFLLFIIIRSIIVPLGRTIDALNDIAEGEGDLTRRLDISGKDEIALLAGSFNKFVEKINGVLVSVRSSTDSIVDGSEQITTGNTNLSQRTEEQASSLEETASSMEEMTSTVRQNADNANQASQLAQTARDQAEAGGSVVSQAVTAMGEINTSSSKIADIISVVEEIAFQTNLLALNAAVEAARAGEQGRGFAVVASEVRVLAGRSADAAKEIKTLIEDSVSKVKAGSDLVDKSGETLGEIVTGVKKVSDIVFEIAAASQEQSTGIDQVNKTITQMDEMTQQNASMVEEATAASLSMSNQAQKLNELISFFKLDESQAMSRLARSTSQPMVSHGTPIPAQDTPKQVQHRPNIAPVKTGSSDGSWEDF